MEDSTKKEGNVDEQGPMPAGGGCAGRDVRELGKSVPWITIGEVVNETAKRALINGEEIILLDVKLRAVLADKAANSAALQWEIGTDFYRPPVWIASRLEKIREECSGYGEDLTDRIMEEIVTFMTRRGIADMLLWEFTIGAFLFPGDLYGVDTTARVSPVVTDPETLKNIRQRFDSLHARMAPAIARLLGGA